MNRYSGFPLNAGEEALFANFFMAKTQPSQAIYVCMAEVNARAAEILRGPDGERIWLTLIDYSLKYARRCGWHSDKALPQGLSPEGIAKDVLIKVLEGSRTWDETKEPSLLNALMGMARSDIGHLFSDYEASHVEPITRNLRNGLQRTADDFPGKCPDPERETLQSEHTQLEATALDLIREKVEGRPELESVFLALYESDSPKDIARLTGLCIEKVYSLCRELDRIATKITPARVAREAKERIKHG